MGHHLKAWPDQLQAIGERCNLRCSYFRLLKRLARQESWLYMSIIPEDYFLAARASDPFSYVRS